jgi:tetratricopeptide (TPR) repeat protein
MGEPERQRDAYAAALSLNPDDPEAQGWKIDSLVNQGDLDGAIEQLNKLVKQAPELRVNLARLLIDRNLRRSPSQRNWSEVNEVIDALAAAAPESVQPLILRATLLEQQNNFDGAWDELEKAQSRFPKSVELCIAQVELRAAQGRREEALKLLDQAKARLGDKVEFRLARARLLPFSTQPGQALSKSLIELAQDIEAYSKEDQGKLLIPLARALEGLQDLEGAIRLLSQLVRQYPNDVNLRLQVLDLAFQAAKKDEIEKSIKQIEEMEGPEGLHARLYTAKYLIWQASKSGDKREQEVLRTQARDLLNKLRSRRGDWSEIPLALAQLEDDELKQRKVDLARLEAELAQRKGDLTQLEQEQLRQRMDSLKAAVQAKAESIISSYGQAIKLGQRGSAIVRRMMELLEQNDRAAEALDLLNTVPMERAADLRGRLELNALGHGDLARAEEIARKAIEANPRDFLERIRLAEILMAGAGRNPDDAERRRDDAETELRKAVDIASDEPIPWIILVNFLLNTGQLEKAASAVAEADAKLLQLPEAQKALTLAECSAMLGDFFDKLGKDAEKKKWNADAEKLFEKALSAKPESLPILISLTKFLVRTKHLEKAELRLRSIVKPGTEVKSTETRAWAKRQLADLLSRRPDPDRLQEALAIFEPDGKPAAPGQEGKSLQDPDDLRILASVLGRQNTAAHRTRAIGILESLVARNDVNPQDRFLLAGLYEGSGDWPRARETYADLDSKTKALRDLETIRRRPEYLSQFISRLLAHYDSGEERDLVEAQKVLDELKQLVPDALAAVDLQLKIYRRQKQVDKAVGLIQSVARRPNLAPQAGESLAEHAEKLNRFDLAEQLYRDNVERSAPPLGTRLLALFLGRRDRFKEALDLLEPLWNDPSNFADLATDCTLVLLFGHKESDPVQLERACTRLDRARQQAQARNARSTTVLLANLALLRERQENYPEARRLYEETVKEGNRNAAAPAGVVGNACNNLAWLIALQEGKAHASDAIKYVDAAIVRDGPLADYLDTRGMIYLIAGDNDRAIIDLRKAAAAAPTPDKLFHLAQAYLKVNPQEAKKALEAAKAKGLEPGNFHKLERKGYERVLKELEAL